tara:strand:- start:103 stop:261 length:159 start_codon:yes stop_codon:yes gene_type:complete
MCKSTTQKALQEQIKMLNEAAADASEAGHDELFNKLIAEIIQLIEQKRNLNA